ncbi:unnamed protein product [Brassica rapa subsp. trilocularis]
MNTTTQTRSTKIVCLSNRFRQWRLHTLSLPIGKPDAAPGEGSVFMLSGFDVSRKNPKFRLSDALLSIWFNDGTSFEKRAMTVRTIPTEMFRFPSYDQLPELANTGKQLPGMDTSVCVSMFDSLALAFHSKFDSYGREPRIVAVLVKDSPWKLNDARLAAILQGAHISYIHLAFNYRLIKFPPLHQTGLKRSIESLLAEAGVNEDRRISIHEFHKLLRSAILQVKNSQKPSWLPAFSKNVNHFRK